MNWSSVHHGLLKKVYVFLDQRKQAKIQWIQDPCQSNKDNLNDVRREASRHFRNKMRNIWKPQLKNLKLIVRSKILGTCIGASMTLRRVTSLELIQWRMRRVIWLQTPTVIWLGGGNISPSYWMYMGIMMLDRQKYTQQNHKCLLRLSWLLKS